MSSSFEKSVKGATKVKVRVYYSQRAHYMGPILVARIELNNLLDECLTLISSIVLTSHRSECSTKDEIYRAHPRRYPFRRSWRRRGLSRSYIPPARFNMDRSLQKFNYCSSYDQRRIS